jgi:arylsulfatase A-like enzyme
MFGEGGIRIPMILSMPGSLPQGKVNDGAIVSTMDIFPTVAELAGIPVPKNLDGKSLLPLLQGQCDTHHDWLAWAQNRNTWVIRKGPWKLTHQAGWTHRDFRVRANGDVVDAAQAYVYPDEPQLFNLAQDIGETTNLIEAYPGVVRELRALYRHWDQQMAGPMTSAGKPKK